MALSDIMMLVPLKLVMALSHCDGIKWHHDDGAIKVSDGIVTLMALSDIMMQVLLKLVMALSHCDGIK